MFSLLSNVDYIFRDVIQGQTC